MRPVKMRKTAKKRAGAEKSSKREFRLSNLEKVLYPKTGFTKGYVIDYYARVAEVMLPHLHGRPVTLKRYPNGVDGLFFYEKMCPSHRPDWVATTDIVTEGGKRPVVTYCVIEDLQTLMWVANLAALELHTVLSRQEDLTRPTMMVFDHDPGPGTTIIDCITIALRFRDMLKSMGLESFPKTSGGKGLHLYVPLNTKVTFEETKQLARAMAQAIEQDDPKHVTSNMRKEMRQGRVFLDWSQNDDHKTTVCAYSLRASQQPTVSTPITWEEAEAACKKKDARSLVFTTEDVIERVAEMGDLFAPVLTLKQKLPKWSLAIGAALQGSHQHRKV